MTQTHRTSFFITLGLMFLMPLFFIPGGSLDLSVAKSTLLSIGLVVAFLAFLLEIWRGGKLDIPWHPFVLIVIFLPLIYLISSLFSVPSSLSLFGYNFEVGTFGFVLLGSMFLILISTIYTDVSKVLQALTALLTSFSLIALFATIKILSGGSPVFGAFFGNTANPVGAWTDLAVILGLLSILSILVLSMISMKKSLRALSYVIFWLSILLLCIINFTTTFIFTLGASVILFVYFSMVEKSPSAPENLSQVPTRTSKSTFFPIVLGVVSVLFLINPTISSTRGTLSEVVANISNVSNSEVRPSFSATLSVSKAALSQSALLGSGPNTFSQDWLIYRPAEINTTPFWSATFPFGVGFIPTQVASTGILGILLWLIFFVFLIIMGVKALTRLPESKEARLALVGSFLSLLYLWAVSFMYAPSIAVLTLAFIFSGLFLAVSRQINTVSSRALVFSERPIANLVSTLLVVILALGSLALGFVASEKTLSTFYFKKAVDLSNTSGVALDTVEAAVKKATAFAPADVHYVALSRIYFSKAQTIATSVEGTPEENLAIFQDAISKSIEAARQAVAINPADYQNWVALGVVYNFLVPAPLSVAGSYENASIAYTEAANRNPLSPEIPLLRAQLEYNHGDIDATRSLIRQSLALKEDYADAYLMLARLEAQQKNISEAIASAERLATLIPGNPAIYFELGVLKYSNKDYLGAVNAFALAVNLVPDYANAQYYFGLSLAQLGRLEDALAQFNALSLTNPGNSEVQSIIRELESGKTTFLNSSAR